MPPIRSQRSQKSIEQEGRILLAIQAIKKQEIRAIREAARHFNVPESTLRARLRGTTIRSETRANSHKLTEIEEQSLVQWIFSLDDRGAAPRPSTVREMADLLLAARGDTPVQTVGENWVSKFVKRHSELSTRFSRRYNSSMQSVKTQRSSMSGLIAYNVQYFNMVLILMISTTLMRLALQWV